MKQITFINKTTESAQIFRSTPEERKRINERTREHRVRVRSTASNSILKGPPTTHAASRRDLELFKTENSSTSDKQQSHEPASINLITERNSPAVCPLVGRTIGGLGDPFNTFSIPLTTEDWRLIQFYRDIYYKRLWAAVSLVLGTALDSLEISRCSPDIVIKECLQIPSRMWSLLASASCNLQHETNVKTKSLLFVDSGTTSLRNDLQTSHLDRHSLLNSIHLHLAASSLHQEEIARAHLHGARAILRELVERGVVVSPPTLGDYGEDLRNLAGCAFWEGRKFLGDDSTAIYLKAKCDWLEARNKTTDQRLMFEKEKGNQAIQESIHILEAMLRDMYFVQNKASSNQENMRTIKRKASERIQEAKERDERVSCR